jgi:hypothetical protein
VGLHGQVAWLRSTEEDSEKPGIGVRFGALADPVRSSLERLLILQGLPSGPWRATVGFGMEAVGRMP